MIRILYYKLPSEVGENVLLTDHHIYRDSELAILVEFEDLENPFYTITYNMEEDAEPVIAFSPRDKDDTPQDPQFLIDSSGLVALLPFKRVSEARAFAYDVIRTYDLLQDKFDA